MVLGGNRWYWDQVALMLHESPVFGQENLMELVSYGKFGFLMKEIRQLKVSAWREKREIKSVYVVALRVVNFSFFK